MVDMTQQADGDLKPGIWMVAQMMKASMINTVMTAAGLPSMVSPKGAYHVAIEQ